MCAPLGGTSGRGRPKGGEGGRGGDEIGQCQQVLEQEPAPEECPTVRNRSEICSSLRTGQPDGL